MDTDHVRKKDGMQTMLDWLPIIAARQQEAKVRHASQ